MDSRISVKSMLTELLAISHPLEPFDMPLLDAHGATLAADIFASDVLVLEEGVRIRSPQVGLAASLGLSHLPTQPHPRVVVISAGADLVEPGQFISEENQEFESNSWMLTTAAKEAGAIAYRVQAIPSNAEDLKAVVEDQLVRADLIVLSGRNQNDSSELIEQVLQELGEVKTVIPAISGSSEHCYGTIGEDKIPVIALPGDPIAAYLSFEMFVRPMIRTMLGVANVFRRTMKAVITKDLESPIGVTALVRATIEVNSQGAYEVTPLADQDDLFTLSQANVLIAVAADSPGYLQGELVDVIVMDRTS